MSPDNGPPKFARAMLRLYPKGFREAHGDEMLQLVVDRRAHGGEGPWKLWPSIVVDTVLSAPRMRLANLATNHRILAVVVALLLVAAFIVFPLALLPIVLTAIVIFAGRRKGSPWALPADLVDTAGRWLLGAVLAFAIGVTVLIVDAEGPDQELSEIGWLLWFGSWVTAFVFASFGTILGVARFARRVTQS